MVKRKLVFSVAVTLAVALSLELLGDPALSVPYKPPKRPPPGRTSSTTVRTDVQCADQNQAIKEIIPLIPDYLPLPEPGEEQNSKIYSGFNLSEYPILLVYLPKANAQMGELVLRDENNRSVTRTRFSLPNQAGIVSLDLADTNIDPLEPDKPYWWSVSIICDEVNRSENGISARVWFQRITPSATLGQQIFNARPTLLPALYAQGDDNGGFWYDALSSLADLRQLQPNNPTLENQWQELLDSAGLLELTEQPLLDCCQFQQQDTPQP
ncbi:conserved domain protein [Coleofasciculus chthonoplastes PCC 7420]|uniref:Conserved domain protein n=1 Tax=Coleofasciculus chthonoplastes PCC 7420 TaxID=118168 RepID=B4VV28_9CYAN|nr:DUF928 domain-containing protein [Coleofasciculus chthonoplastes]EDX74074.1 conserved domain protein [Coleofasciculus chthonoplastes PCC 7420]